MKTPKKTASSAAARQADAGKTLRQRAEALARQTGKIPHDIPEEVVAQAPKALRSALHELRVHQIELEMQNQELRRTQQDLEDSRARYFDLYDLAPVGYLTISEQGLILEANLTAAQLLGVARGKLFKQPLSRFVFREDQDTHYLHRKTLFEAGTPQRWELRLVKKDGAPFWARVDATTAHEADGASVWRAVISDITESKRVERAVNRTNAELQEFAYALTHDLREPLRMVVNFTQLLALEYSGKLGAEAEKYIAFSIEGALRMEALLKEILKYWEMNQDADRSSVVDCNEVLSRTLLSLKTAMQENGVTVTAGPLPAVVAREVMVAQLFQNLISNSIKYRSAAPPRIHVSAERTGEGWLFSVLDNGIGIDPNYAERVFGLFKRLHGKEIPGTGMGLALCRLLVERRGGRIWVESELGSGATFKFTIPTEGPH